MDASICCRPPTPSAILVSVVTVGLLGLPLRGDELQVDNAAESQIGGEWIELSFQRGNDASTVEMDYINRTQTLVPTYVVWTLTSASKGLRNPQTTRRVLRGETNDAPDDLPLGAFTLDEVKTVKDFYRPNSKRVEGVILFDRVPVRGIFRLYDDFLLIALPNYKYRSPGKYDVAKSPVKFDRNHGQGPLRAMNKDGNASEITVYTLQRSADNQWMNPSRRRRGN